MMQTFFAACGMVAAYDVGMTRLLFPLACIFSLLTSPVWAQSALDVLVVDEAGAPLDGASVTAANDARGETRTAVTDQRGRARFGGLAATGGWQVTVEANGARAGAGPLQLRNDFTRSVVVRLTAAIESILVTARADALSLNRSNAEISGTLTAAEIERLPVEARSLERLLFRLPGVTQATGFFGEAPSVAINGANALYTNYMIDGLDNNENFLGGQRFLVPVGAVQDVTVLVSSYSAEFGRTANGIVNVTTPSGSNDIKGRLDFVTRPGGFLTADPDGTQTSLLGAPVADSFARYQGAATLSGPVIKDRLFAFANVEIIRDATDNLLSAPDLGVTATLPGRNSQVLFTGRMDATLSPAWRAALRVNVGDVSLERQGGGLDGGVTFPSAGSVQDRRSLNAALTLTYAGDRLDYTGALNYSRFRWNFGRPLNGPGPQATVFSGADLTRPVAVLGHPGFTFDSRERTVQTKHVVSTNAGAHRLKVGVDILFADFALAGGGNPDGNVAVSLAPDQLAALGSEGSAPSPADLPADAQVLNAVFETQPNRFGRTQRLYGLFLEDQWRLGDAWSVTLGLRYDYDSLTSFGAGGDYDNISPRLGFNYTPHPDVSIRGGIGRYIEKIPYAVLSDALQQGSQSDGFLGQLSALQAAGRLPAGVPLTAITSDEGNRTIDAAGQCMGFGQCPDPTSLRDLATNLPIAERRIFNPFGLENPEAWQASVSGEWRFARTWKLGVDLQYSRGRKLLRLVDLNAPAPFDFNLAAFNALGPAGVAALTPAERIAQGLVRTVEAANLTRPALMDGVIPVGGARSIIYTDSGGRNRYTAMIIRLQKARGRGFYDASLFYTLSQLKNDTDDINFRADDANRFERDFGPSLNDRRHVISALVSVYPVDGLTVSLAGLIQSGQPINLVPDPAIFGTTDLNGDGLSVADQFTGNPDRFPGSSRNSGRLPWSAVFDLGVGYALTTPVGDFGLRADIFNVFNANRESGFPVNFTASNQVQTFGGAFNQRSAGQARTLQVSASYSF